MDRSMNTDQKYKGYAGAVRSPGEDMLSPKRPPHMKKKGPSPMALRILRAMMIGFGGMILLLSLVLCILPLFRAQTGEVVGNSYYSAEDIMEAAEISVGDEVFAVDLNGALQRLIERCPYLDSCKVEISSPSSLKITVFENSGVMYTEYGEGYVSFEYSEKHGEFFAIEVCEDDVALKPFLRVRLPKLSYAAEGKRLRFANSSLDVTYVKTLIDALEAKGMLDDVRSVDAEDISMLSYTLESGCRIKLGTMDEMTKKLDEVQRQLSLEGNGGVTQIDVTNPHKPTVSTAQ